MDSYTLNGICLFSGNANNKNNLKYSFLEAQILLICQTGIPCTWMKGRDTMFPTSAVHPQKWAAVHWELGSCAVIYKLWSEFTWHGFGREEAVRQVFCELLPLVRKIQFQPSRAKSSAVLVTALGKCLYESWAAAVSKCERRSKYQDQQRRKRGCSRCWSKGSPTAQREDHGKADCALKHMKNLSGADIHEDHRGPYGTAGECAPKGVGKLMLKQAPGRKWNAVQGEEHTLEQVFWQELWPHRVSNLV